MADYAYTTVPGKVPAFLRKIREVGVPAKASVQWIKTIGFTSSNDTSLIGVLKQVGLVDPSAIPTPVWSQYRGGSHRTVLGNAIRSGYADLFAVYPDADKRSVAELEHVFSTSSSAGKQVIAKTVSTFKSLCESATFEANGAGVEPYLASEPVHLPVQELTENRGRAASSKSPSVHIDIQVHIAPESSPEQIDQIFKSMAKHLYGKGDV